MATLKIMDYADRWVDTGVELNDDVTRISIMVITGDHIARVTFRDGTEEEFDSSDCRMRDCYDGSMAILDKARGIDKVGNYLQIEKSYDIFDL